MKKPSSNDRVDVALVVVVVGGVASVGVGAGAGVGVVDVTNTKPSSRNAAVGEVVEAGGVEVGERKASPTERGGERGCAEGVTVAAPTKEPKVKSSAPPRAECAVEVAVVGGVAVGTPKERVVVDVGGVAVVVEKEGGERVAEEGGERVVGEPNTSSKGREVVAGVVVEGVDFI